MKKIEEPQRGKNSIDLAKNDISKSMREYSAEVDKKARRVPSSNEKEYSVSMYGDVKSKGGVPNKTQRKDQAVNKASDLATKQESMPMSNKTIEYYHNRYK